MISKDTVCAQLSPQLVKDTIMVQKSSMLTPFMLRQSSCSRELSFPITVRKVLETICVNLELQTPTTKDDYISLLYQVKSDEQLRTKNIATIIRSLTDICSADRQLQKILDKDLGFCFQRRIFKNSAQYDSINCDQSQSNQHDIGTVHLFDFLILLGQSQNIFPESSIKFNEQINKENALLLSNTLLRAICSQDEEYQHSQEMVEELLLNRGNRDVQKLLDINIVCNETIEELQAKEVVQQPICSSFQLFKPQQKQQTPQNKDFFKFLHNNQNQNRLQPGRQNDNPQYSFTNSLRQQDKKPKLNEHPFIYGGFKKVTESVISANNSQFNTPLRTFQPNAFHCYSEQKPTISRNIFSNEMFQKQTQFDSFIRHDLPTKVENNSFFTPLGKRRPYQDYEAYQNLTTPLKRQKQDPYKQESKQEMESEEESDEENNINNEEDLNNSASRKKRGLKILSVKVQELVNAKQKTTYKDVANELIEQLRKTGDTKEYAFNDEVSENEEDQEDESSVDMKSPGKKSRGNCSEKKASIQKWEKNVRRRVYDALNVLYAAGVLKKEGKHVFCDNKAMMLTQKMKEQAVAQQQEQQQSQQRQQITAGEARFMRSIELLKQQVEQQRQNVEEKREMLAEQVKHLLSYKQLILRNQEYEENGRINKQKTIHLPFILVSTQDSPDNEVDISCKEGNTMLNIAMRKPLKCFGDADALMSLGMYKVDYQFYLDNVPQSQEIVKHLSEQQLHDILIQKFERELKAKLTQKSTVFNTEEATLMKAFKYFDLDNNGTCEPDEFAKAIEKIGVVIPSKRDLEMLFKYYDTDGSGSLDYKEFCVIVCGNAGAVEKPEKKSTQYGQGLGYRNQTNISQTSANELVDKVRVKLASRGARGIIGLGKQFKIFDDDNSRSLDQYEFTKAMKEQMLGLSDQDIIVVFNTFDRNRDGTIDYDEFVRIIRGPMNNFRKKLVAQAFNKIDKDGSGYVDINDIKGVYNAKRHPDVIQGKKTEEDILMEFLETFEAHHNIANSTAPDHIVTIEEFEEYHNNISSSVDNDQYFELMITNAWKINEGDRPQQKAWSDQNEGGKSVSQTYNNNKPTTGQRPQPSKGGYASGAPSDNRFQTSNTGYGQGPNQKGSSVQSNKGGYSSTGGLEAALSKLRQRLASRGARGFIGLSKQFKIIDDNNSGTLDMLEFKKAIKDFKIDLNEQEIKDVFAAFDRDGNGTIDYDEFVRGVRGPMNSFRQNIVKAAFKKLDKDGSGVIDLNDIRGVYNAKNHPEVKSGKKSEDEILGEFLDTFEMHHSLNGGGIRDKSVTMEEFIEYYNNVSASIDNDQYFELMMINAWKLHGEASRKPGWTNTQKTDIYQKGFSVTSSAPFGVDPEPTDYSTNLRPRTQQQYTTQSAAGSSSWGVQQEGNITGSTKGQNPQQDMSYSDKQLLEVFSNKLASRGARGIIGLSKQFKIADDDRSHDLDMYEFKKAIKDFRVPIIERDVERLFNIFDRDRSGKIDYDEFLRGVRGEMNNFRRSYCEKAFKIMDKDKSGVLNIDDLKGVYNGKKHPDVIAGKKTEEEILGEFLDTFELHYSLTVIIIVFLFIIQHENSKDRQISMDEWIEYYNNVSMSIDDDKYFEVMMNSTWNLDGARVNKKGWAGEY